MNQIRRGERFVARKRHKKIENWDRKQQQSSSEELILIFLESKIMHVSQIDQSIWHTYTAKTLRSFNTMENTM